MNPTLAQIILEGDLRIANDYAEEHGIALDNGTMLFTAVKTLHPVEYELLCRGNQFERFKVAYNSTSKFREFINEFFGQDFHVKMALTPEMLDEFLGERTQRQIRRLKSQGYDMAFECRKRIYFCDKTDLREYLKIWRKISKACR